MNGIAKAYHVFVHEIGDIEDHVHLLISLPRVLAVSKLAEVKKRLLQMDKNKEHVI